MKFLDKMERKFSRYAIPHLTIYIIVCYVIGYLIEMFGRITGFSLLSWIVFSPKLICHGQVWRLVTWILVPPSSFDIFTIIMLFFYYSIGTSLEQTMGDFRYNVFIFGGVLWTIIGVMAGWGICNLVISNQAQLELIDMSFYLYASTYYLSMSIFLAYALCYPDMQVLLYFVIPVKVRWMAIFYLALMAFYFVQSPLGGRVAIGMSLLNLAVFFLCTRRMQHITPGQVKRRQAYRREVKNATPVTKHKCAVCGRTEQDGDDLEFRFCSRCNGNYEYCQEHLFTHTHIQ